MDSDARCTRRGGYGELHSLGDAPAFPSFDAERKSGRKDAKVMGFDEGARTGHACRRDGPWLGGAMRAGPVVVSVILAALAPAGVGTTMWPRAAAVEPPSPARLQTTTVVLAEPGPATFTLAPEGAATTATLTFGVARALPGGATPSRCTLRVVPTALGDADQGAHVVAPRGGRIGGWDAHQKTEDAKPHPFLVELDPSECASHDPNQDGPLPLELRAVEGSRWQYHGGGAGKATDRPRLIVTYGAPIAPRAGSSTDWIPADPIALSSSHVLALPPGRLLTAPFSHGGSLYVIGRCTVEGGGECLFRIGGAGPPASGVRLGHTLPAAQQGAFAAVGPRGRLQLVTNDGIIGCELSRLGSATSGELPCDAVATPISVELGEPPAMGPDGALYLKNVRANGRIVAYDAAGRELWQTALVLNAISPIALNEAGTHAYALARVPVGASNQAERVDLLRIDLATGETRSMEVKDGDWKPLLSRLFRPVIASRVVKERRVDYVFVSGNTSDKGLLQLVAFDGDASPAVVWTHIGKIGAGPVLGVKDEASLFVVQGGELRRFRWFSPKGGAPRKVNMEVLPIPSGLADVTGLLVDGGDDVHVLGKNTRCVWTPSAARCARASSGSRLPASWAFTPDGALIGHGESAVHDLSPWTPTTLAPAALAPGMVYGADCIVVPAGAERALKGGDRVKLRAGSVALPRGFRWPLGAELQIDIEPR